MYHLNALKHCSGLGCCPFKGGCSFVVGSFKLFVGVLCLIIVLLCSTWCPFQFCNHLDVEERELVALNQL